MKTIDFKGGVPFLSLTNLSYDNFSTILLVLKACKQKCEEFSKNTNKKTETEILLNKINYVYNLLKEADTSCTGAGTEEMLLNEILKLHVTPSN